MGTQQSGAQGSNSKLGWGLLNEPQVREAGIRFVFIAHGQVDVEECKEQLPLTHIVAAGGPRGGCQR